MRDRSLKRKGYLKAEGDRRESNAESTSLERDDLGITVDDDREPTERASTGIDRRNSVPGITAATDIPESDRLLP
jgi:hypothetical protein